MAEENLELEEIEVKPWDSVGKELGALTESYQVTGIQYAFVSSKEDGYRQCHRLVHCREFLCDVLRMFVMKTNESIYGFTYNARTDPPIDLEAMRMVVAKTGAKDAYEIYLILDHSLRLLHHFEEYGRMESLSKIYKVVDKKTSYVIEGPKDWMESTFMISLFTFLVRLGAKKLAFNNAKDLDKILKNMCTGPVENDFDRAHIRHVHKHLYKIVDARKKIQFVSGDGKYFFASSSIDTFHSYTGIVALCEAASYRANVIVIGGYLEELYEASRHIL